MLCALQVKMRLIVAIALAAGGCASGALHPSPDAAPADGGVGGIDARPSFDARPGSPDAAPADAVPVYDAVPPAPDAEPCTPSVWVPLLDNGNFDSGHADWSEDPADAILTNGAPLTPHSGTWVARLLGSNSDDELLSQAVTVPASATALRLRGYQCLVTSETGGAVDNLAIELRGAATEVLVSISNLDAGASCNWAEFTHDAASAHAGQTIDLAFDGLADAAYPTSFYFDTLVLEAYACP